MRNLYNSEVLAISGGLIKDPNSDLSDADGYLPRGGANDYASLEVGATRNGSDCSYNGTGCAVGTNACTVSFTQNSGSTACTSSFFPPFYTCTVTSASSSSTTSCAPGSVPRP
jgi:hypothetical protein